MTTPPYAAGFRSLDAEVNLDTLPIEGELPSWLSGSLLRTGPAKFEVDGESFNHWFDGLAMLHAFGFAHGAVSYACRFLKSRAYRQADKHGRIYRSEFATDPCRSLFGRIMSVFSPRPTDNACVNIGRLADRHFAMTETPMPIEFDPETLETLGQLDYGDEEQTARDVTTAHPHWDAQSNSELNYVATFGPTSTYRVMSTSPHTLEREVVGRVETARPAYVHSFGMTENYVVLVEFPFVVNPLELLFTDKPFIQNYRWKPGRATRFHIMRKSDGKIVAEQRTKARFGFHHVNAFERSDELVVDVVTYDDSSVVDALYLDRLRSSQPTEFTGRLERFRLPLDAGEVESRRFSDTGLELPRINYEQASTRPHRYVWGVGEHTPGNFIDQVVRLDIDSGESRTWHEPGCYPGEPVFVMRPDAEDEDDGVLLSVVLDSNSERSFLLVLDAATLEEQARAWVPHHVPFSFHGQFFED